MNGRTAWAAFTLMVRALVCLVGTVLVFWVAMPTARAAEAPPAASAAPQHHHRSELDEEMPPDVREKLTPEQLHDVMLERAKRPIPPNPGKGAEILIPIAFFVMIIFVVAAALYAGFRKDKQRHETLRTVIEKGGEIPAALLLNTPAPRSDLRRGILLCGTGLGLGILLLAVDAAKGAWTCSFIPLFLGIGYLVVYRFEQKKPSA